MNLLILVSFFLPLAYAQNKALTCTTDVCKPPSCFCASKNPPGGLSGQNIPQFITLTWDDAITCKTQTDFFSLSHVALLIESTHPQTPTNTALNQPFVSDIMGNNSLYKNPNGCPLAATFFVSTIYNEYVLSQVRHYNTRSNTDLTRLTPYNLIFIKFRKCTVKEMKLLFIQ